jgi:uncharacterized membrane protein YfcA
VILGGDAAFLIAAGIAAGVVGTAGGITSLVSYPALLAVGIGPFAANVTNAVALIGSGVASSLTSGPELRDHRATIRAWAALAVAGGVTGAVLLLVTPPDLFAWIVPVLIVAASVLLLVQPRIVALRGPGPYGRRPAVVSAAVFAVSAYSGYFGAGAGVLIIAVFLLLVDANVARANALKNAILLVADLVPGVIFAIAGPVSWRGAITLAVGASVGGAIGPRITRRAPHALIRLGAALMGFVLAGWLCVEALR